MKLHRPLDLRLVLLMPVLAALAGCVTTIIEESSLVPLETLDQKPVMNEHPRPEFPPELRQLSVSGRVVVEFIVDSTGHVHQTRVLEATPAAFARTGANYFLAAKFTPGRKDGHAVNTRMQMPFIFHLNEADSTKYQPVPSMIAEALIVPLETLDQKPVATFTQRPQFPFSMRRKGIEGSAVVEFIVDAEGNVQGARAVKSSHEDFGAASAAAVSKWKFQPGIKDGRAVNTRMQMPMAFTNQPETKK